MILPWTALPATGWVGTIKSNWNRLLEKLRSTVRCKAQLAYIDAFSGWNVSAYEWWHQSLQYIQASALFYVELWVYRMSFARSCGVPVSLVGLFVHYQRFRVVEASICCWCFNMPWHIWKVPVMGISPQQWFYSILQVQPLKAKQEDIVLVPADTRAVAEVLKYWRTGHTTAYIVTTICMHTLLSRMQTVNSKRHPNLNCQRRWRCLPKTGIWQLPELVKC